MLDTLLFDLDGTLLPFVQADFNDAYFAGISAFVSPLGSDGEQVIRGLWEGIYAMLRNDGSRLNRDVFWDGFIRVLGDGARELESVLDDFYTGPYDCVRAVQREQRELSGLMAQLREKGYTLVLATNPVFPAVAVAGRMAWVGLKPSDFDYVTSYENSGHCKPDPAYYRDILARIGREPQSCMMIGNNPGDDGAAREAGLSIRILTDYLENERNLPLEDYPHSSFAKVCEDLLALPSVK